jgi:hypothetical protein
MGGSGGGRPEEVKYDSRQLQQELNSLRDPNSPEAQAIKRMLGGQLSPEAELAQKQSLSAINLGAQGAIQGAREQASARGLFSSDIGIGLEQNAMQNLAGQRAGIYQQRASNIQQGILSGLSASQGFAGLRGNLASTIAGGQFNADQQNAQMMNQWRSQQQQMGLGLAQTAGSILAAPVTGGTSLLGLGMGYGGQS